MEKYHIQILTFFILEFTSLNKDITLDFDSDWYGGMDDGGGFDFFDIFFGSSFGGGRSRNKVSLFWKGNKSFVWGFNFFYTNNKGKLKFHGTTFLLFLQPKISQCFRHAASEKKIIYSQKGKVKFEIFTPRKKTGLQNKPQTTD